MKKPDQESIDQYIRGELSPAARKNIELMMNTDVNLKREILAQREAIALAQSMGDQQARETIRRAMEKGGQKQQAKNQWPKIALLLVLLLSLAVALFYFLNKEKQDAAPAPLQRASLYSTHYQIAELTFGNRGSEEVLAAASIAYQKKDFPQALQLFEQADPAQTDAKINLAKAICHIELNQYEQAEGLLSRSLDDPLSGAKSRWYLGLLLLRKNDPQAIQQFEILAHSPGAYQQEAQDMVQELKKINE